MTTLIAVFTSDGCVGRCDAKCYNATEPECHCVCGGKNHGAGRDRALANTRQWAEQMLERYAEDMGLETYSSFVHMEVKQTSIFDLLGDSTSSPASAGGDQSIVVEEI